ncbi:hypothetical protein ZIOFF_032650 [Zingiber officinale]|uniref:FH2 domain-containing protein n=1 Tax=Zingiber officinale TaxID=94328 RepID=A0A8J5L5T9_ZINOF|nr:hypothetical protein ZIOFF_032650 [Zingiber officinale]
MDNFLITFHVHNLDKLKDIMKKNFFLGNTLNQGTAKVLAEKATRLLDFHEDLVSLEAASKIPLKSVAKEQQQILKGLEMVEMELIASKHDGPVSETSCKALKEFTVVAAEQSRILDSTIHRSCMPLKRGLFVSTLLNFVLLFRRTHEMDCKQAELEKKKAPKEAEEKSKERCIYIILASEQSENLAQQMPRRLQTGLRLSYTYIMYTVFSSPFLREAVFWNPDRGDSNHPLVHSLPRNFTRRVLGRGDRIASCSQLVQPLN